MKRIAWALSFLLAAACTSSDDHGPARTIEPIVPDEMAYVTTCGLPVQTWRAWDATIRQSLNGTWRFLEDPDGSGDEGLWYATDLDRNGWRTIEVPGVWNATFPELLDYEGVGWYALDFDVVAGIYGEQRKLSR